MADLHKFTSKEVLNKVLLTSGGSSVAAFSHTTAEALNAALDSANSRLNVSLAGGTISGDVTISGDLTVSGSVTNTYDEQVDGQMWIKDSTTSSASQGGHLKLFSDDGAAMADDHRLGVIEFAGAEDASSTITVGARIEAICDASWSATENGTELLFYTTDGNASQGIRFLLDSNSRISLSNNDSGGGNTLFGKDAGDAITSGGSYNVAMGQDALGENTTVNGSTAIGYESQLAQNGGNNTTLGYQSMKLTGGGSCFSNVGIGTFALYRHSGQYAVAIGEAAGYTNSAHFTTAIGAESLRNNTDGQFNTAVGYGSLKTNVDGDKNTAVGYKSLFTFEAGSDGHGGNSALGWESGMDLNTGKQNTLIGENAGGNLTDGDQNTALGSYALAQTIAGSSNNTALGFYACGAGDITNSGITAVGAYALAENVAGQKNVAVGFQAGNVLTAGSQNTIVGYDADTDDNSATNQTVIGSEVTGVADNSVTLGNASVTAVYMASNKGAVVYCSGVNFPDTPVESADDNTLDDYEEGIVDDLSITFGGNSASQTYNSSRNQAKYTKVGNRVFIGGFIELSAKGSSTGAAKISGLPFTIQSHTGANSGGSLGYISGLSFADFPMIAGENNTTNISFAETTNSGTTTTLTEGNFTDSTNVIFSFHYNTQ